MEKTKHTLPSVQHDEMIVATTPFNIRLELDSRLTPARRRSVMKLLYREARWGKFLRSQIQKAMRDKMRDYLEAISVEKEFKKAMASMHVRSTWIVRLNGTEFDNLQ